MCATVDVSVQAPALQSDDDVMDAIDAVRASITAATAASNMEGLVMATRQLAGLLASARSLNSTDGVEEELSLDAADSLGALQALLAAGSSSLPDTLDAAGAAEALVAAMPNLGNATADSAMQIATLAVQAAASSNSVVDAAALDTIIDLTAKAAPALVPAGSSQQEDAVEALSRMMAVVGGVQGIQLASQVGRGSAWIRLGLPCWRVFACTSAAPSLLSHLHPLACVRRSLACQHLLAPAAWWPAPPRPTWQP